MIKELLNQQKKVLLHFFSEINSDHVEELFERIYAHPNTLFLTGVGKSGFIAQKIAATIMSIGKKAFFLSPIDALHGDIGMVHPNDLVIFFSKTGETEELLQIIPALRNKNVACLAFTSSQNSRLTKAVDAFLYLPCLEELCPFNLAPTSSAEIQLLIGDLLTIYCMKKKSFTLQEYSVNHPAGFIGKKIKLKVKDLMLQGESVPICQPHESLAEVLENFSQKRCGCIIVTDQEKKLHGIFTDGDLRRALQNKGEQILQHSMSELMTKTPRFIQANALAHEALSLMESDQKHPIMILPVLEKEQVVGIIKMHDLIQSGFVK